MQVNDLIEQLAGQGRSKTMLTLNPTIERMPLPIRRYDDPFLPFGKAIISATRDLVCGYVFHFADYLALGAAGAVALERTLAYAGSDLLTVLHGPFADHSFARLLDATAFNAHLLTLAHQQHDHKLIDVNQRVRGQYLTHRMRLETVDLYTAGDDVLYADFGEDFATRVRERLEAFNDQHHS